MLFLRLGQIREWTGTPTPYLENVSYFNRNLFVKLPSVVYLAVSILTHVKKDCKIHNMWQVKRDTAFKDPILF